MNNFHKGVFVLALGLIILGIIVKIFFLLLSIIIIFISAILTINIYRNVEIEDKKKIIFISLIILIGPILSILSYNKYNQKLENFIYNPSEHINRTINTGSINN